MDRDSIFSDKEYREVLTYFRQLTEEAESLPYPQARDLVFSLLKAFDSIHREPLIRLVNLLRQKPEILDQLSQDQTIKTLLQLYDLSDENAESTDQSLGFVPIDQVTLLQPLTKTEWLELGALTDFQAGELYARNFEQVNFLISRTESDVFAVQNACVDSILPIDKGAIDGHVLTCPWHGCRYDLRTGENLSERGRRLQVFPTQIEDGQLKVEISYPIAS